MNDLMEKLNKKNKDIEETLVVNFVAHLIMVLFLALVAIVGLINGVNEPRLIFRTLYFAVVALSIYIGNWIAHSYINCIKSEMRVYKGCVDVAMHHKEEELPSLEKDEEEHIPKID